MELTGHPPLSLCQVERSALTKLGSLACRSAQSKHPDNVSRKHAASGNSLEERVTRALLARVSCPCIEGQAPQTSGRRCLRELPEAAWWTTNPRDVSTPRSCAPQIPAFSRRSAQHDTG